ncbi:DUF4876 domain-containing protein [Myroides odoratimimus]|uniref:DUF4876 domain-containing protein n=1 Tax=Myroides odoratimimus TaxID=76832 RepID=UPI0025786F55|nr:DUF4876 domain-containing protein [Myroides odoratimimus]MDM1397399.1 DUF4876 domain-containing protein [Myroides odoratimimus]
MIKRLLQSLSLLLVVLGFNACSSDDNSNMTGDEQTFVTFWINDPQDAKIEEIKQMTIKLTELNSNKKTELVYEGDKKIQKALPTGTYDITVEGVITHKVNGVVEESKVGNFIKGVVISGREMTKAIDIVFKTSSTGFVIEEIFFAGTKTPQGLQYTDDQYFKITNNSDEVLYLDGMLFVQSKFMTNDKQDYTPNIMGEALSAGAILQVPGKGKDHPVEPGKSVIFAENAINHREFNSNSIDLTNAEFQNFRDGVHDVVGLKAAKMITIHDELVVNIQGSYAYALVKMPEGMTTEKLVVDNIYDYEYEMIFGGEAYPSVDSAIKIPNSWIVDAVNLGIADEYMWNVTSPSVDMGYTYITQHVGDEGRYGKAVRRNVLGKNAAGNNVLKDTNNSTVDFAPAVRPSLFKY